MHERKALRREHGGMLLVANEPATLLDRLASYRPPVVEKVLDRAST